MPLKIYYPQESTMAFWSKQLEDDVLLRKPDEFFFSIIQNYLSREGRLLDEGCGQGHLVAYLSSLGYDVIGIDFSRSLIKSGHLSAREKNVLHVGDLKNLPYKESTFSTCISEGVFEHFEEGPQMLLSEAKRVLKRGGCLIITVPYYNILRKVRGLFLPKYHYVGYSDEVFFEYAFTKKDIRECVENEGFKVVKIVPISPLQTLKLDVAGMRPLISKLLENFSNEIGPTTNSPPAKRQERTWRVIISVLFTKIVRSKIFREVFSHMVLVIAKFQ